MAGEIGQVSHSIRSAFKVRQQGTKIPHRRPIRSLRYISPHGGRNGTVEK